jgi:hypothetical protein
MQKFAEMTVEDAMLIASGAAAPVLSTQFGDYVDVPTPFTFSAASKGDSLATEAARSPSLPTLVKDDPADVTQVATRKQERN